jgi:hypothetical protein
MIAPLREEPHGSSGLSTARRAVAAALLDPGARQSRPTRPVSNLLAWSFVAGAVVVAVAYYAKRAWWTIPPY